MEGHGRINKILSQSEDEALSLESNPEEEKFLNSPQGQEYMASAVYRAIKDYKEFVDAKWQENEKNKPRKKRRRKRQEIVA